MGAERRPVRLILEDGAKFDGFGFGADSPVAGEVVFNTGMIGYPETLTDPSYRGQILVQTYPLVGNYGVPNEDIENGLLRNFESDRIQVSALVLTEYSERFSHWSAVKSLDEWLSSNGIPGVYGIDTRALTKHLREHGTMLGKLVGEGDRIEFADPSRYNLVAEAGVREPIEYGKGRKRILIIDCGVKNNIIRAFLRRGLSVLRCPWDHDISKEDVDGIVISNGPGDPKMCAQTIANARRAMESDTPILGICLGSQILGLAAGADTYKLKYGHRGQNQPCAEVGTKRCYITSQNHGYAVSAETLPEDWREWFYNNNDRTNEGIIHVSKPFFGTQFHPEASPGPDDTEFIFDMFLRAIK